MIFCFEIEFDKFAWISVCIWALYNCVRMVLLLEELICLQCKNSCRYYHSLAHVASLFPGMFFIRGVSLFSELCSTPILRSVNGVLAILCSVIVYEIITLLRPNIDERKATIFAVVLALYPLHWFFTFLYYTDVASLTTVLAMYLACLKKKYHLSALVKELAPVLFLHDYLVYYLSIEH